jgi:ArsR family transcriptional regulator
MRKTSRKISWNPLQNVVSIHPDRRISVLDLEAAVDVLSVLGDPTRVRLMALLVGEELTVAELTRITDLPQSRVSTHLGRLRDAGLLRDRRVGASTFYTASDSSAVDDARRIWSILHQGIDDAVLHGDGQRRETVVQAREKEERWPDAVAGRMERHYSPGRTWEATARGLLGLIQLGDVLDVGSGDGVIAHLLAPRARSVTCLDRSQKAIDAARTRLSRYSHVRFAVGNMHDLPFDDESFDHVLLFNVLTFAEESARALQEAARTLRSGGNLALITLGSHEHSDVSAAYDHVNQGFVPKTLRVLIEQAGFVVDLCEVTSRERRKPYFRVITAFARKPGLAREHAISTTAANDAREQR